MGSSFITWPDSNTYNPIKLTKLGLYNYIDLFYKLKHFDEHQSTIENIINGNFDYCKTWGCLKKQIANKRHMNCLPNYNIELETSLNKMSSFNFNKYSIKELDIEEKSGII